MGNISLNKLGGLSIIVGPVLALVFYLLQPGGLLIDSADPSDAQATIAALVSNSAMSHLSAFLIPLGLLLFLYGFITVQNNVRSGGNGDALSRLGVLLLVVAVVGWVLVSGLTSVIANNIGQAAGAVYAVSQGLNSMSALSTALGFLLFSYALSTRDDYNKMFALLVAVASLVSLVATIVSVTDASTLETTSAISAVVYIITSIWAITIGLGMLKE